MSAACAATATPIAASAALVRRRIFTAPPKALPSRFRLAIQGQSVGIGCHLKSTVDRKRRGKGWQNLYWATQTSRAGYVRLFYAECSLLAKTLPLRPTQTV